MFWEWKDDDYIIFVWFGDTTEPLVSNHPRFISGLGEVHTIKNKLYINLRIDLSMNYCKVLCKWCCRSFEIIIIVIIIIILIIIIIIINLFSSKILEDKLFFTS